MLKNSSDTAFWGSLIAFFSGLNLSDWASIFGILFGLFTILINWYYKQKDYKLKEMALQHEIHLKEYRNEKD